MYPRRNARHFLRVTRNSMGDPRSNNKNIYTNKENIYIIIINNIISSFAKHMFLFIDIINNKLTNMTETFPKICGKIILTDLIFKKYDEKESQCVKKTRKLD
jgi:hypothetical protein